MNLLNSFTGGLWKICDKNIIEILPHLKHGRYTTLRSIYVRRLHQLKHNNSKLCTHELKNVIMVDKLVLSQLNQLQHIHYSVHQLAQAGVMRIIFS